ncbi:MAG: hypothetical protein AAB621_03355 [Patescibacteria group bacterium]
MNIRKMKPPRALTTSEGLILIRQKIRGEYQDSIIVITPAQGEVLVRDLRNARIKINKMNREKKH